MNGREQRRRHGDRSDRKAERRGSDYIRASRAWRRAATPGARLDVDIYGEDRSSGRAPPAGKNPLDTLRALEADATPAGERLAEAQPRPSWR
ncbi:MAG: hypothetical protein H0T41_08840 [Rhodobacteraceae bacterium]|nr:hypothetical protein [Paracoccaceae bacterium]